MRLRSEPDRGRQVLSPAEIDLQAGAAAHPEGSFESLEQPTARTRSFWLS